MAKKKLKFVPDTKFEEYKRMTEAELTSALKAQHSFLEDKIEDKKSSSVLKEFRDEISEYRKKWALTNPEDAAEILEMQVALKSLKEERDDKILGDLDEKKQLEGDLNEIINGAKEHIDCMIYALRFHI